MTAISAYDLADAIAEIGHHSILCLGDVMLDIDVACANGRRSPEAPVLVFDEQAHRARPGGTANVAAGVGALGAHVRLAGVIGDDEEGRLLMHLLESARIDASLALVEDAARPTTRKTRFLADGQQLLRIDRESLAPIADALADRLFDAAQDQDDAFDAILVSDYGKGVVTGHFMARCHALARRHRALVLVDPKGRDWRRYGAVDLIKPNAAELSAFADLPCETDAQVERALAVALERCDARAIIVTRAGRGAARMARGDRQALYVPAHEVEVTDVCGAGDTNLAALGCLLASGIAMPTAMAIAQIASSIAVQRRGNAVVSADDILASQARARAPRPQPIPAQARHISRTDLPERLGRWRSDGETIGFTNGCFDLLHPGHIRSLEMARSHCDRLIVGLNSDASVRRLKGRERPIMTEGDRATVLAGLASVDAVVIFEEDTPQGLIAEVRPDVLIKGGDYDAMTLAGGAFVRSYGGRVIVTEFVPARSTSRIVDNIRSLS